MPKPILPNLIRKALIITLLLAFAATGLAGGAPSAQAASPTVVISQVYGGGGNSGALYTNDFVELFNRGTTTVSLAGMSVQYASATGTGSFSNNPVTVLSGSLAPGQYYLVQMAAGSGGSASLPTPDAIGTVNMSGSSGKIVLVNTTTGLACNGGSTACSPEQLAQIVDLVGWGSANFSETSPAPGTSNTTAILRADNGCTDTDNNSADFPEASVPAPRNSASPLQPCGPPPPLTLSIDDVSLDEGNSGTTTFAFTVSLSRPAEAGGVTFDIATADNEATSPSDFTAQSLTGQTIPAGSATYTFAVLVNGDTTDEPDETFSVNVSNVTGTAVADGQGQGAILNDDADVCALTYTPIYTIQGSGAATPLAGATTTQGVVVGDYEGPSPTLRGFYLQDPTGDGDSTTSDGIFVFNGSNDNVSLGDVVHIAGTAGEFQNQTQINASAITKCSEGSVEPVDITLPFASTDSPERYEGMLVRLPQTLYVTEHFQLGRFGQVVLSAEARLLQPTHTVAPGAPALALQAANNRNRIILDDALNNQNPDPILFGRDGNPLSAANTLRGGDTVSGIVGVLTYTWAGNPASGNAYRVRPVNALGGGVPLFVPANPRPAAPEPVGGTLKAAAFNLLNYFNTFGGCTNGVDGAATDCRGADNAAEFDRQASKTVAAILGLDADVLGIIEIENDGYGPDSAIADLVDRLNAASAPGTYAFIDVDDATGQANALGTDAIKVGLLYKPARVTPVGSTAALNSDSFVNGGDTAPRNRPSLTQAFARPNGERFIVNVNHLKSKGSACDVSDAGDGQGNCNAARTHAANELTAWLATDPTGTGDPDVLILGDLNAYAQEDPVTAIRNAGYVNLIESLSGPKAYSYVFDGQWGYLDHALATTSLADQVTGITEWHINADEPNVLDYNTNFKSAGQIDSLYAPDPFRMSDHDPVLVGLCLRGTPPPLSVTVTPDVLWPPNHQYVGVTASVTSSDPGAVVSLVSVTSNEPDNGLGDGDAPNDIVQVADNSFNLRAERAGNGTGRIYTITYAAVDECGDRSEASATVSVPHSQGRNDKGRSEASDLSQELNQEHQIFLPSITQ